MNFHHTAHFGRILLVAMVAAPLCISAAAQSGYYDPAYVNSAPPPGYDPNYQNYQGYQGYQSAPPVYQSAPPQYYQSAPPVYYVPAPAYNPPATVYYNSPPPASYRYGYGPAPAARPKLSDMQQRAMDNCILLAPRDQPRCRATVMSTTRR